MILPSSKEIETAWEKVDAEGPVPLACLVDGVPDLRGFVEALLNNRELLKGEPYTVLKAAFVGGLYLGIRIGEARQPASGAGKG